MGLLTIKIPKHLLASLFKTQWSLYVKVCRLDVCIHTPKHLSCFQILSLCACIHKRAKAYSKSLSFLTLGLAIIPPVMTMKETPRKKTAVTSSLNEISTLCKKRSDYVFPEMKLRGLVSQFPHSWICERFIYPKIGPPILLQQTMQTNRGNI